MSAVDIVVNALIGELEHPPSWASLLMYGFMGAGKTTLARYLASFVEARFPLCYVEAMDAVAAIKAAQQCEAERMIVLLDDVLVTGHSMAARARAVLDRVISMVRHLVHRINPSIGRVVILYATQKLSVTPPIIRSSPYWAVAHWPADQTDARLLEYRLRLAANGAYHGIKQVLLDLADRRPISTQARALWLLLTMKRAEFVEVIPKMPSRIIDVRRVVDPETLKAEAEELLQLLQRPTA